MLFAFSTGIIMPNATATAMIPLPSIAGVVSGMIGALQFIAGAGAAAIVGLYKPGTVEGMVETMAFFTALAIALGIYLDRYGEIEGPVERH
jgi:DHA1 family bicyclomycin/chloramphenicol resistance-like MFS transporter